MIDKTELNLIAQIISSMEEAAVKLEDAHEDKKAEEFEHAKREIFEFQKKLAEELK